MQWRFVVHPLNPRTLQYHRTLRAMMSHPCMLTIARQILTKRRDSLSVLAARYGRHLDIALSRAPEQLTMDRPGGIHNRGPNRVQNVEEVPLNPPALVMSEVLKKDYVDFVELHVKDSPSYEERIAARIAEVSPMKLEAARPDLSMSGRATLSDARALLTREIQKIQQIRQSPCDAVVDTSIDEDGLYESSIARMSISLSRRVDFGELDLPAHLSLLECRAFGLRQVCFSIVLSWLILALLHRFLLFVCAPESNFYLWMVNVILGCRRWVAEIYCRSTIPRLRSTRSLEGSMDSS